MTRKNSDQSDSCETCQQLLSWPTYTRNGKPRDCVELPRIILSKPISERYQPVTPVVKISNKSDFYLCYTTTALHNKWEKYGTRAQSALVSRSFHCDRGHEKRPPQSAKWRMRQGKQDLCSLDPSSIRMQTDTSDTSPSWKKRKWSGKQLKLVQDALQLLARNNTGTVWSLRASKPQRTCIMFSQLPHNGSLSAIHHHRASISNLSWPRKHFPFWRNSCLEVQGRTSICLWRNVRQWMNP